MYGIHLARYKLLGDAIKSRGMYSSQPLCIFVSANSHYSYKKSMSFLGLGTDHCISVKVDKNGMMMPSELKKAIDHAFQCGFKPLLIGATGEIANEYKMWLH